MRTSTIKHVMYAFNAIFVLTGIIMVAVGASVKSHYYPYYTFLDDRYFSLPNMLIATGSLIFFISFLGCYGAMRENWFILMVFSVLLCIIFIFELSVSIAGYVLSDKTAAYVESTLQMSMANYGKADDISRMWDVIHEEFQCCGVQNISDWEPLFGNLSLPVSCCPPRNGVIGAFNCNAFNHTTLAADGVEANPTEAPITTPTTVPTVTTVPPTTASPAPTDAPNPDYPASTSTPYSRGCHSLFSDFIKGHAVNIGAVGISLAVIQLAGIILSIHLARQLKNSYYST